MKPRVEDSENPRRNTSCGRRSSNQTSILRRCIFVLLACLTIRDTLADCPEMPDPVSGSLSTLNRTDGTIVQILCDQGFEVIGSDTLTCLNNTWDQEQPKCTIKDCGNDTTVVNGIANFTNAETTYGQFVPIICNEGYELTGGTGMECLSDGSWTTSTTCQRIDCGSVTIANGEIEYLNGTEYGAVASIRCSDGYALTGSATVTCLETGIWDETADLCVIKDCGNDTYIVNGIANFTDSETTYGQFVPIICNTGYELTGGTGMVCLQDGMWSTYATCKLIGCGSVTIANGEVEYLNGTDYGAVARIRCSDGYDITGSETVTCLETGTWNKTADHCVIKDCGNDTTVVNGIANFTNAETTYGQFVPITCNEGYELTGGTGIECLSDGTWSTSTTCQRIGCGSVTIANGEVEYLNGTDYGAVARIRCSDGYDLTSSETVMCLDKGTWNKTADHCVIKDCGNDTTVVNGIANFTNAETTYGQFVPITCNEGYELTGGTGIECLSDGTWSTSTTCQRIGCGTVTIANGEVEYLNGTDYSAVARVRCSDGYDLKGKNTIKCLDTGIWDKTADHCVIKDCGKEKTVTNGRVEFSAAVTTYGHFVDVTCDAGYRLTGGTKLQCLEDGTWNGAVTCEPDEGGNASSATGEATTTSTVDFDTILIIGLLIGGLFLIDIIIIAVVVYYKCCRAKRHEHTPIDENEFCEEPVRKEHPSFDEEHFIESPRLTDKGVPKILLSHPPPNIREALPPVRTFQLGQKDVNIVPPLPKKLPPVPDDIRLPQSLRPADRVLSERRPDVQSVQEQIPSTSGMTLSEHTASDLQHASSITEGSNIALDRPEGLVEPERHPESASYLLKPHEFTRENSEQIRESSSIAAPAALIMTNEENGSKEKTKTVVSEPKPVQQRGSTRLKKATSSMPKAALPKTLVAKKPISKPLPGRNLKSQTPGKKVQTPRLKSALNADSLAASTTMSVDKSSKTEVAKQGVSKEKEGTIIADDRLFESTDVTESQKARQELPVTNAKENITQLGKSLSLEKDLSIVSALNEDFGSSSNTDLTQKGRDTCTGENTLQHVEFSKSETGISGEASIQGALKIQGISTDIDTDSTITANAQVLQVNRRSPPPERLPSRESTTSISSTVEPFLPSVEAVIPQERSVLQNNVSKIQTQHTDHLHDTDYSSDSFSSDSDIEFSEHKTAKKPQSFLLDAEITHVPLEHPKTPFLPDTEARTRVNTAATQRRAMSSRLLTSSYGTRSDTQVQAYNPAAEARKKDPVERALKKAKVEAEKADTKKKGLKRLKAMKNAYGSLKLPARR